MKKIILILLLVFIFPFKNSDLHTQVQHQIMGIVKNEVSTPLSGVCIRLSHIGTYVTDDNGEFFFNLPKGVDPGSEVEFIVKDAVINQDTLVIFKPIMGIWNVPKDALAQRIKIELLPKGDYRLLSKESLRLLINEIINRETEKETKKLISEISELKQQILTQPVRDPIEEEAKRLGFTKDELVDALVVLKKQLQQSDYPYEAGLAALYDKYFTKATKLFKESINEDEKLIKEKVDVLPDKYINLGNAYVGEHNLTEAAVSYRKAIELEPSNYLAHFQLAMLLYIKGDHQGALANYRNSLVIIRNGSFGQISKNEGVALGKIGVIFNDLGEPDSTSFYLREALKIHRVIGYRHGEATELGNLGVVFRVLGRTDSAYYYHKEALKINREICYRQGEATDLSNLGLVFRDLGELDSARFYIQAALVVNREISYHQGEARDFSNLGVVFGDLGKPDSACIYHQAALKIFRKISFRRGEAIELGNLGLAFRELGKSDSACIYHQTALRINREIGYRRGEANELGNLGLVFRDLGESDSARICHQAALKIDREIGYRQGEANALGNLGIVYRGLLNLDSARFYHQAALNIDREIGYRQGEAIDLGNIAMVYSDLDEPDSALIYLKKCKKIFHEIKSPYEEWANSMIKTIGE
ncbi:MAG: tetratricopeptide repeat protein [candidate division Zixibacteria bacterium]|nr:tetratricopeptide repeat protein [candidate division Zixibacteria bacterium]